MLKTVVLLHILVETEIRFNMETFCKIINVFTGTFDQFNASLVNKFLIFFYIIL